MLEITWSLWAIILGIIALFLGYRDRKKSPAVLTEALPLDENDEIYKGRSYIMYHGTSLKRAKIIEVSGFVRSEDGMLGPGVYLSRDEGKTIHYAKETGKKDESPAAILKVLVNVGRVKKIDYQGHPLQKTWMYNGYDTAWVPAKCGMVRSGRTENCIWDPMRITVMEVRTY